MIFSAKRNAEYHQKTFRSFNDTPHAAGILYFTAFALPRTIMNAVRIFARIFKAMKQQPVDHFNAQVPLRYLRYPHDVFIP